MAKGAYIGVGGKARKVKKKYIGVDGVARKIKKAYIGIGGVARPCFGGGELVYWGKATNLSTDLTGLAAASTKNEYSEYAFFGGGYKDSSTDSALVEAYDTSLTRHSAENLSTAREALAAAAVGYHAIFAGGCNPSYSPYDKTDAFDDYLERVTCDNLTVKRYDLAATTVGVDYDAYALFAGGYGVTTVTGPVATVDAYAADLTRTTATSLSSMRRLLAATTVGNHALFGGGKNTSTKATVDAYDESLTRTAVTDMSTGRVNAKAVTVGGYALFCGGHKGDNFEDFLDTIEVYDSSLTKMASITLSEAKTVGGATSVGDYAVFAGGYYSSSSTGGVYKNTVDVFDSTLTRTNGTNLSVKKSSLGAATVGDFALFAGGTYYSNVGYQRTSTVEVYAVQ